MESVEVSVLRRQRSLFALFESVQARESGPELAADTSAIRQLAFALWHQLMGDRIHTPDHRRAVVAWCLSSLERLSARRRLPLSVRHVVAAHLARELAALAGPAPAPASALSTELAAALSGPAPLRRELVQLYLLHNLYVRLVPLDATGLLGTWLMEGIRADLARRAHRLFRRVLPVDPDCAGLQRLLDERARAGRVRPDVHARLTDRLTGLQRSAVPFGSSKYSEPASFMVSASS